MHKEIERQDCIHWSHRVLLSNMCQVSSGPVCISSSEIFREGGREGAHSLLTASSRLFEMAMKLGLCPAQIWTWCEKNHTTRDIWDLGCRPAILGKTKLCLCHWSGTLMWPFLQGFPTHQAKWLPRTPVHCKVEVVLIRASDNLGFFKADT